MKTCAGIIPSSWRRYNVPAGLTVIQWITDFSLRIRQLQTIVQATLAGARELKVRLEKNMIFENHFIEQKIPA